MMPTVPKKESTSGNAATDACWGSAHPQRTPLSGGEADTSALSRDCDARQVWSVSSSCTSSSVAEVPPSSPIEVEAAQSPYISSPFSSAPSETPRVRAPRCGVRQTTLTGELPLTSDSPRFRPSEGQRTRKGAAPRTTTGNGERMPLSPGSSAARRKREAPSPPLSGPAAVPLLEEALLAHLKNALGHAYMKRAQRGVELVVHANPCNADSVLDALAESSDGHNATTATFHEGASDESAPCPIRDFDFARLHVALPCLQYFILSECARLAREVREHGGNGLGDDPATRAFQLLGFLLSMLRRHDTFAALLTLACPSCRAVGLSDSALGHVLEFLVLTQRTKVQEVHQLDSKCLIDRLGLREGCHRAEGGKWNMMECCPFGEAHAVLHLLFLTSPCLTTSSRADALDWAYVPITLLLFPDIETAAWQHNVLWERYIAMCSRRNCSTFPAGTASRINRTKGNPSARPRWPAVPTPTAAERALLQPQMGGLSWAEELLAAIVPEEAAPLSSRIRSCYAYTSADISRGGFFTADLRLTAPLVRSPLSTLSSSTTTLVVYRALLFSQMEVVHHIAESYRCRMFDENDVGGCTCGSDRGALAAHFLLEEHLPYLAAQRQRREERYLLGDSDDGVAVGQADDPVDVDIAASQQGNSKDCCRKAINFYAAGSFARFRTIFELTASMSPLQLVKYVTQSMNDVAEPLPELLVPRQYIHAVLKRHQLEDVQMMWDKECEGYSEFLSVPLYHVEVGPATKVPLVRSSGIMHYCAATNEMIIICTSSSSAALQDSSAFSWSFVGEPVRGGLLGDDVGLGKTLTMITLCALDRTMLERSDADAHAAPQRRAVASAHMLWQSSDKAGYLGNLRFPYQPAILRWAFGKFRSGVAAHPTNLTRLPRTTLVVVPLSIAAQWIEEIRRFYPAASCILFHGVKRARYSVEDLNAADFVVTSYETLSTHLRQEADGLHYWMARSADSADDVVCARAASRGWSNWMPSALQTAVQSYAKDVVWPDDIGDQTSWTFSVSLEANWKCHPNECSIAPHRVISHKGCKKWCRSEHYGERQGASRTAPLGETATPTTTDDGSWTLDFSRDNVSLTLRCPALSIFLARTAAAGDTDTPRDDNSDVRLTGASADFLDHVWELLKSFASTIFTSTEERHLCLPSGLFDPSDAMYHTGAFLGLLFSTDQVFPLSTSLRHELVRRVLLPPLWKVMAEYWAEMKSHYSAVATAEVTGRPALRLTDLFFRRVVLDESQKCGPTTLFHLLNGERRWAMTGTPINNNNTESFGHALRFLRMCSAERVLGRHPAPRPNLSHIYAAAHIPVAPGTPRWKYNHIVWQAVWNLSMRSGQKVSALQCLDRPVDPGLCACAECFLRHVYGITDVGSCNAPAEIQVWRPPCRAHSAASCLPNTFFDVLAVTMVRHEGNQQVRREIQLAPVQYCVHEAPLSPDEMTLYDRVARVIMDVASRMHRQGVLTMRMGRAMQWVQDLCRLCLHPSRVGNEALLRGDITVNVTHGIQIAAADNTGFPDANISAVMENTFVDATPAEALTWARSVAFSKTVHSLDQRVEVPQETEASLKELAQVPPVPPQCGVCMDVMVAPTLLRCFHLFCKECLLGVVAASRTFTGNLNPKCPYCRDRKSLLEEKRVVVMASLDACVVTEVEEAATHNAEEPQSTFVEFEEEGTVLDRIGDGARVNALVNLVEEIWRTQPDDGVLVFSKYPSFLQLAHDAVVARGYQPYILHGALSLAQRQQVMRALQSAVKISVTGPPPQRRILFVTSRSANAGLNLTFANHVIFLEPNLNPAMEQQAIGRVHRFGQAKAVYAHHMYAPRTIEEVIYRRSERLRNQAADALLNPQITASHGSVPDTRALQQQAQFGRVAPAEVLLLLEYPVQLRST